MNFKQRMRIQEIEEKSIGKTIAIGGWIKTAREQKNFSFLEVSDGSCFHNIQVIVDQDVPNYSNLLQGFTTGASVWIEGEVKKSPGGRQAVELKANTVTILGGCPADDYPLQKKRHSFEFLRTIAHLRPRTNTQGAVLRVRNALAFATHLFFQKKGFIWAHTPIVTASDCEGGGKQFLVTTLELNKPLPKDAAGQIDYTRDFFGKPAYLTVSGQLNGETIACAMTDIYTFGPTFRAENSNTTRHLAEFWMIEPEMAFADLNRNMDCAEDYLKYVTTYVLEHCIEDLEFFNQHVEPGLIDRLKHVISKPFERMTYTKAIEILQRAHKTFEYPVEWGCDLQSEHERYLAEECIKGPLILTDYPKKIKAFYMRENTDGQTVAAMDVLVPKIGEIIGGSQREERLEILTGKIIEFGLNPKDYWWYLDLRKYGSIPHAGFGAGFERLVLFVTGMENIRDVIPFPRFPGNAEF